MLIVKTTPHLYGISLQGDYTDLNELYYALSRYLAFYQEHAIAYPYDEYEYLLSLNYDIRHAFQGDRNYILMENNAEGIGRVAECLYELPDDFEADVQSIRSKCKNSNLYFSVEILYPMVFHYLFSLERILNDYYSQSWFAVNDSESETASADAPDSNNYRLERHRPVYTQLNAEHDRSLIGLFTSLLWNNVSELFGTSLTQGLYTAFWDQEIGITPNIYTDAVLHRMLAQFHTLTESEKKDFLLLSLIEIMDGTELMTSRSKRYMLIRSRCREAQKNLKAIKKEFPVRKTFYRELSKAFPGNQGIYMDAFDDFLDKQYGKINIEDPEW